MADGGKLPHLSDSYYGPSIPGTPRRTFHRPGRSSGGGGGGGDGCCCDCNPLCCCCNCLLSCICNCIFQIIITVAVVGIVLGVIVWFIFRPNKVTFHVSDASLLRFDYSAANDTLRYDLSLNVTIRNSNKRLGIYYDRVEASALYGNRRFASSQTNPFFQGHKNTTTLINQFKGQQVMSPQGEQLIDDYNWQKSSGMFKIDLKLYLRVRFKWLIFKSWHMKPKIKCGLKVPLVSNRTASAGFQTTKCGFDW